MDVHRRATCAARALIHLDSGAVHRGLLYAAHSNYDESPMASSVEVLDAHSLEHVDSHAGSPTSPTASTVPVMSMPGSR